LAVANQPPYASVNVRSPASRATGEMTKFEAMDILNKDDIPCGPILSMKEIAEDQSLRTTGTVVEVDHPTRGKYISVGNPIKLSPQAR
jgi:formyl-CoA transferase